MALGKFDPEDLIGHKFGRLTVESFVERDKKHRIWYRCQCDCGKETLARRDALMAGSKKTCGDCSRIEKENDHYRYYCHICGSFIFDECDLELVQSRRWLINSNGYVRGTFDGRLLEFARVALGVTDEHYIDHINGDKTDNRRCNLRIASVGQNSQNKKLSSRNKTGYKGVTQEKGDNRYRAQIIKNYQKISLGWFETAVA